MKQNNSFSDNGFTLGMALTDFFPVALFCIGGMVLFRQLHNGLFFAGVLLSTLAGLCKAGWKLIISSSGRDIPLLPRLFHYLMPSGFVLMLFSVPFALSSWNILLGSLLRMPALIFVILGCIGMAMMMLFAVRLDRKKASSNWIEQLTNTVAQICFVLALLLA